MPTAWLPLRTDLPGRADVVARARGLLESGQVTLSGTPGIGKTSVAGAIVAGSGRGVLAVSLLGCEDPADAVRALGHAAGVHPCGDEAALQQQLARRGPLDLVIDDVGNDEVLEPVQRLAAALDARLVVVGELSGPRLVVDPLPDDVLAEIAPGAPREGLNGNPTLARLAATSETDITTALARLGPMAALLATVPVGFADLSHGLPAAALVPEDRVVLRRGIAAHLPDRADLALALPHLEARLRTAVGAHPTRAPDPRDFLAIRQLARGLPVGTDRARATATAARLAAQLGQVEVARALIGSAIPNHPRPAEAALLFWADADVLFGAGEVEDAVRRWEDAAGLFRRARDGDAEARVLRRAADRMAARGLGTLADTWYRQARQAYRALEDTAGVAATLRGAADLAVGAGEGVTAGTLHEQVSATLDRANTPLEHANLRIGEATLAIARGEFGRAERLLAGLGAVDDALLKANVGRRRADLLLRQGRHDEAAAAAASAAGVYTALGEGAASAACVRLEADVAAAAGDLETARRRYAEAVRLQVRIQDLVGLARTLEHAAIVEEAAGDLGRARLLRQQRAAVKEAS